MSQQLSSSSSFTVITIEDGVSVQAQYAPNSTPSSSQIHNTWQDGDLYMRTRETDGVWSDWHRIVGERGDETDYSFGISIYKTTANASAPPSDISTWSDVPIAVTEEKPFLWSKVEKKTMNESTQQYVVESTRYIRLTGEDGNDGVSYIIESSVGSVTIASNKTSESISNVVFSFFKKEGDAQRVPYQCYCTVFRKKGSTYTMVRKYTTAGAAVTYSNDNITVANYDAIVVCIYNESSESHSDYLAEYQIPVWKHGDEPYFADIENEMDSIACDNVGHPSSVQSVNTSVSLFKGSSKLSSTIAVKDDSPSGTSYTNGVAKNGITVTWNNTTGAIGVSFSTDATVPEVKNFCIIVTSSDLGSTITKYLYFTVNGVRAAEQGDPAVLYRLVTNTNQIVKKKDGSYVPAIDTYITCAVTKTVGSTESTPPATEYTLTYILNETGGEKTDYTDTKIKVQDVTKNVVFILRVSDVVVDRETVPLVSDGDNGTDAKDIEWVYIRTENNLQPEIYDDANYTDHNGNVYTNDNHLPRVNGNGRTDIETNSGTTTYPECTNSPKGVTDVYKYEWEIKRSKGNAVMGSRSWLPYSGTMTLHNNLAESAFIIDLDNDNDQFGTDSESKVLTDQTRRTIATLYDGAEPQTLTELTVSLKYEDETTTVPSDVASYTTDVNTGAVTITIKQNLTTAFSHTEIKARITAKCAKGEKNAMFTIRKIMGGAPGLNPIIYQLSPTQSSFSFSRDANNALTPSARSSVINALKTEGNSTVPATAQDGLTYKWGWDESTTPIEEGKLIGTTITVLNTQAAVHNQVWVELSTGDRETISITKDGESGDDAVTYEIEPSLESVTIPSDTQQTTCSFVAVLYRRIGQQSRSRYLCYFGVYVRTGNNFERIAGGYDDGMNISNLNIVEGNSAIVIFMFSSSYTGSEPLSQSYLAKYEIAIFKNGNTGVGERGKVGRFFYYAQEWEDLSYVTYVVTDAQAPYFKYGNNYWVFNPQNNYPSGISMHDMGEPSSRNINWRIMTNDFKYIITEAIFGSYAHFGASIINGDYLLSQYVKAFGFGGTKIPVDDNTKYVYIESDDMFGEGDMYDGMDDESLFPLVQHNTNPNYPTIYVDGTSYTDSTTEESEWGTLYARTNQFRFPEWGGNMYCVEIEAFAYGSDVQFCVANNEYEANMGYDISGCSGIIQKRYTADDYYYTYYYFFTPPSNVSTTTYYRVYFKLSSQSGASYYSEIRHIYIRRVKFVPNFCLDMLRGKLVANDIVARGELHADSLFYDSILASGNNNTYRITSESIVTLNYNSMGTRVILPNPQDSKGRVIEIFSGIQDGYSFSLGYDAATTTTYFKCSMMGSNWNYGLANFQSWNSTYLKLWSDGTYWYILKDEHTVWVNDQYGYRICLNNKYHSNE